MKLITPPKNENDSAKFIFSNYEGDNKHEEEESTEFLSYHSIYFFLFYLIFHFEV